MSKTATNGAIQTDNAPVQVTFALTEKELAMVPSNIAEDQDKLNQFGHQSLLMHLRHIAEAAGLSDMSHVDQTAKETMRAIKEDAEAIPDAIKEKFVEVVGVEEGQALKPVFDAINTAATDLNSKADVLNNTWNLDSKTSTASVAMDTMQSTITDMKELLDEGNANSIQQALTQTLTEVTDEDGILIETLKTVVEDILEPYSDKIDDIETYIQEKHGESTVIAKTTLKGKPHELKVHLIAKDWVDTTGGTATHCGPDNQPGDTVLEVSMPVGDDMRIVIESKDEDDTARGIKSIDDKLVKAMQLRQCDTGLWICKTEGGLSPTQIGSWGQSKNSIGPWLATTVDNVKTALIYLRAMELVSRAKELDVEADIDLNALQSHCVAIRGKLKKIQTVNTKFGQIVSLANEGKSVATDLRTDVRDIVTEIESIIKVAMASEGAA